jgi:hypothetical protein
MLALTANPFYALHGVKPGARLASATLRLKLGKVIKLGRNDWYVIPGATSNGVLKVRHGIIQEVGIATKALTAIRAAQAHLLSSFYWLPLQPIANQPGARRPTRRRGPRPLRHSRQERCKPHLSDEATVQRKHIC